MEPVDVAHQFIALINEADVNGIIELVTPNSRFFVEGEEPVQGREPLRDAWLGYLTAFPRYQVFIDELHQKADAVYIVGHTSGSHVPTEAESLPSSVVWRCEVANGLIAEWSVYPATEACRTRFGLGTSPAA